MNRAKVGSLVTHLTGEWSEARQHIGIILDVRKDRKNRDIALVYLPTYKKQLTWHMFDNWHLQHFWTFVQ